MSGNPSRRSKIVGRSKRAKRPPRPPREGEPVTVWDLSRDHRLGPIEIATPEQIEAIRKNRADWVIELAWDGHRVQVFYLGRRVRLVSADFREWHDVFPTIGMALQRLIEKDVVLEGWICALGDQGMPSFELLRLHAQKQPQNIILAATDLLRLNGEDLRGLPLRERRERLAALIAAAKQEGVLLTSDNLQGSVDNLIQGVAKIGGRGVIARRAGGSESSSDPAPKRDEESARRAGGSESSSDPAPKRDEERARRAGGSESSSDPSTIPTDTKSFRKADLAIPAPGKELQIDRILSPPPRVTNQDKLMYPRDGISKKDVVAYYDDIAPIMLQYTRDRPIVGQRWPDGIDEFTWYQHRMPPRAPDYLRAVWIEGNRRIIAEHREALMWLANQAVLTFHGWASRYSSLSEPDWVVIDLDPGTSTTWPQVIEVATALRKLLELLELPSVPKTSGQKGIHVLIPIGPGHTVQHAHELARRAGKMLTQVLPHLVTLESSIEQRGGRLYIDHLQNFVGKGLVLPYSLRAADGAPVSTPLKWSEVTPKLDPKSFTLRTLRKRLDAHGDIAAPLLTGTAKILEIIGRMEK